MPITEMTDELFLKTYKITYLQYQVAVLNLEIIEEYGCMHDVPGDPDFCKRNYTNQKANNVATLNIMWTLRGEVLAKAGYSKKDYEG